MQRFISMLGLELTLFASVLAMIELGYRFSRPRSSAALPSHSPARQTVTDTVQALIGLILAFSFSDAAGRPDLHRRSVVDESNAIGGAWSCIDLVPKAEQEPLRVLLRGYLDTRIHAFETLPDMEGYEQQVTKADEIRKDLWKLSIKFTPPEPPQPRVLLLTAIGTMGDIAQVRTLAVRTHMSSLTTAFMFGLILSGSLLVGSSLASRAGRSWLYRIIYASVVATAVHVIIDMEYPRNGVIRTRDADDFMLQLRQGMG